jgi:hypothetical protein
VGKPSLLSVASSATDYSTQVQLHRTSSAQLTAPVDAFLKEIGAVPVIYASDELAPQVNSKSDGNMSIERGRSILNLFVQAQATKFNGRSNRRLAAH